MIDTYQFIKYNSLTNVNHIKKYNQCGSVICFDLEDSICDWINGANSDILKKNCRDILDKLLKNIFAEIKDIKIGIRINSIDSDNFLSDLDFISKLSNIHTIIIPKIDSKEDLIKSLQIINSKQLQIPEIIPLIESKKGLDNLPDILNIHYKIRKIGFGHCDYNLDIKAFPFFHQDTREYWKWIKRILLYLKPHNIKLINSAFLELDNSIFFESILTYLNFFSDGNFGQFTLSSKQTRICQSFNPMKIPIDEISENKLDLSFSKSDLEIFISNFEKLNDGQAFTIIANKKLISPQEYNSAKYCLKNWKSNELHFTFVGGCFPVQENILFEDLFHQLLKKHIETHYNVNFNINIIRYERFINCLNKISSYNDSHKIDYLIFHIRPEPFLRIVKFFYKYLNYNNKICSSLNVPILNILKPEKYDLLMLSRRYSYNQTKSRTYVNKVLVNINYIIGWFIGNKRYAAKKYLQLITKISSYCNEKNIKLIILGPAIRKDVYVEKLLSVELNRFMQKRLKKTGLNYIYGLEDHITGGVQLFNPNGILATEEYHRLIEQKIYKTFQQELNFNNP